MTAPNSSVDGGVAGSVMKASDRERAREIDDREDIALRHAVAEPAGRQRADDVEQPDDGDGPAADLGGQSAVDQIGRQVDGDEGELEAAGEEAEHEQHVAAMRRTPRDSACLSDCCAVPRRCPALAARRRQRERERQHQQHEPGEDQQRGLPAECVRSATRASGENRNWPNEPGGGAGAERERAPAFRQRACRSAPITMRNEQPARPKPISTPAERWSISGVVAIGHQGKTERIEDRAAAQHAHDAEAIGEHARRTAAPAPHSRFWIAIASANTSRPQPLACDSGVRNWPSAERGPKRASQ